MLVLLFACTPWDPPRFLGSGACSNVETWDWTGEGRYVSVWTDNFDGDGLQVTTELESTDLWFPSVALYTYDHDEAGRIVLGEMDAGLDGSIDWRFTRAYDARGNTLRTEWDYGADGVADNAEAFTWDDGDRKLTYEYGLDGTGLQGVYTYLPDGSIWLHAEGFGDLESLAVYRYDPLGRLSQVDVDDDFDTVADARRDYAYDEDGRLVLVAYDHDADGVTDSYSTYTYDAAGHAIEVTNTGASWTRRTTYTYDADGKVLVEESDTSRRTWAYDADGRVILEEHDDDLDGVVNFRRTWTYGCPA